MNGCEQIIKIMREQGAKNNPASLQLGEMLGPTSCKVEGLNLEDEDLIISEHLTDYEIEIDIKESVKIETQTITVKVKGALKKGDLVLVQRLSDERYVIVGKLVEVV